MSLRAVEAAAAAKRQRERVLEVIAKTRATGITAAALAARLFWPQDSVDFWVRQLLDLGEIAVADHCPPDATDLVYVAVQIAGGSLQEEQP